MPGSVLAYAVSLAKLRKPFAAFLLIDVLLARMSDNYFARPCHFVALGSCLQAYKLLQAVLFTDDACMLHKRCS